MLVLLLMSSQQILAMKCLVTARATKLRLFMAELVTPQVLGSCEGLGWFAKLADMYRNALLRSAHTTSDGGKSHRYCIRWLRMRGHRSHGSASH